MKKRIRFLGLVLALVAVIPFSLSACGGNHGEASSYFPHRETKGVTYALKDDGTYVVTGYSGSDYEVYLDDVHEGKPVSGIEAKAFMNNGTIESVVLPDGAKYIGSAAFKNCPKLARLYLPDTLVSVGESALADCPKYYETVFHGSKDKWNLIEKDPTWIKDDLKERVKFNYGSPWTTSIFVGNRPTSRPRAEDDLYTHYNFDFLKYYEVSSSNSELDPQSLMSASYRKVVENPSYSDSELNSLRLLYNQLIDEKAMKNYGLEIVKPYIDKIDRVTSIHEYNSLLLADDFPFLPFVHFSFYKSNSTSPTYLELTQKSAYLTDNFVQYYENFNDDKGVNYLGDLFWWNRLLTRIDLELLGMASEEAGAVCKKVMTLEGACFADTVYSCPLDESLNVGNIPLLEIVKKYHLDVDDAVMFNRGYFTRLSEYWNDAHLDLLKLATKALVLLETRGYRDQSIYKGAEEEYSYTRTIAPIDEKAMITCNSRYAFADVIAKSFVRYYLGTEAQNRFVNLTNDIIKAYKELLNKTDYLSEKTIRGLFAKLDKLRICMLTPKEGFLDYGDLVLSKDNSPLENYFKLKEYRCSKEAECVIGKSDISVSWYYRTPTEFNAMYIPADNSITVFPGYILDRTYNKDMDDIEMYGKIGYIIAHEISHALTGPGAYYDANGVYGSCIYEDADLEFYDGLCAKLAGYLNTIEVAPGKYVDGKNTYFEMIADILGIEGVIQVMKDRGKTDYDALARASADFDAMTTLESEFDFLYNDVHPLNNVRVNVMYQMQKEIHDFYHIKEGDKMYLAPKDRIVPFGNH